MDRPRLKELYDEKKTFRYCGGIGGVADVRSGSGEAPDPNNKTGPNTNSVKTVESITVASPPNKTV
jgi:hypothetical protein